MYSIIPTSELISIFIFRQFTMFSFNIGIFTAYTNIMLSNA